MARMDDGPSIFVYRTTSAAMSSKLKNLIGLCIVILIAMITTWAVRRFHQPGKLDVIAAQAMDMSEMRPPTGAAPVALADVKTGTLDDTVTYTGSIQAYNEQDISPRITGTILSLPVYPGNQVRAGQLVAQLDSAEVSAKTAQAVQEEREADINAQVAHLTHHLHHRAAVSQATAQLAAANQSVADANAEAQAARDSISDAQAGVQSAQANAAYWKTEIAREKQLADAGAASRQEYQNELAQAQAAFAGVNQAKSKLSQARAMAVSARAKVRVAERQVDAAQASVQMAQADVEVAKAQALQAQAGADASQAAVREASVMQGYTHIVAPANGLVTARPVAPGTLVQPGTVILKIAEIDRVRVQANVAVTDLGGIHVGSPVEITLQDGGKPIRAAVSSVFPSANTDTRTSVVEVIVPNPNHRLLPGSFVTMNITKHVDTDKMLVPASAIVSQGGQSYVWIAKAGESSGPTYECVICHIHYTAAQAKKFHYIDPMEGGKLVPLKGTASSAPSGPVTAHEVPVQVGGSNGTLTEVTSDELTPDAKVFAQGTAGLTEGARIVATAWGPNGPKSLPDAASANAGLTLYRCEKCGMTYSEADAKKDNFIDPMDGGRLVPIKPQSGDAPSQGVKESAK
jgi:multidrug efflux pump subunit AcrA (membrane-fusion protein)